MITADMNTITNKAVANEILNQLGGSRFIAMTGARNFVCDNNSLGFKLPARMAKDRISWVKITLNAMDTYDMEFKSIYRMDIKTVCEVNGVYNDGLVSVFEDKTGLPTSL